MKPRSLQLRDSSPEEIIANLDYQFAMRLADNNDAYNRDLSMAEKMQILYFHQMLLK